MKERPLLVIVMAILHILEPLFKIFYFKTKTNFDLSIIQSNVTTFETIGLKGLIDFWLIFPFAGIALLSVKKYAWYFFVLTQAYSIVTHLTYERFSWPYFSEIPFFLSVLLIVTNFFLILYVCVPKIRKLFFKKNNRWWETSTRYKFIHPINFWHTNPEKSEMACIQNISETGALIKINKDIEIKELIQLEFAFQEIKLKVKTIIIRENLQNGQKTYGVKFLYDTPFAVNKFLIKKLVNKLKRQEKIKSKIRTMV